MSRLTDKLLSDIKLIEDELKAAGLHRQADRIANLRRGHRTATRCMSDLHKDNAKLREEIADLRRTMQRR